MATKAHSNEDGGSSSSKKRKRGSQLLPTTEQDFIDERFTPRHEEQDDSGDKPKEDVSDGGQTDIESDSDPEEDLSQTKVVQPLSAEALAEYNAAQDLAGVVYISRIPPGMRPTKVRHLMTGYGEVGRVYLQQEDPKRAYLRRKHTSTKKAHYTEGWVEFKSKKVARSVAEMLNAQPIGGKKGTRWRDDIWTMKYLPRFKWYMLTEQVAHEAAAHTARLRVELSQSKSEQQDYLRQVELARVLDKRSEAKRKKAEANGEDPPRRTFLSSRDLEARPRAKKPKLETATDGSLKGVLDSIF